MVSSTPSASVSLPSSLSSSRNSRKTVVRWTLVVFAAATLLCQKSSALASAATSQPLHILGLTQKKITTSSSTIQPVQRRKHVSLLTTTSSTTGISGADVNDDTKDVVPKSDNGENADNNNSVAALGDDGSTTSVRRVPRGGSGSVGRNAPPALPTLKQYAAFAFPCLALWVAGPLLSLVDTAFVGLSTGAKGSAQQLAALGPATTFFDGFTYLFAFLNVATTNLYSSARAQDGPESEKAESVVRTSAQVAIKCGFYVMLVMLAFTRPLLRLYIGDKASASPGLLDAATDYVCIRAFSMPTSLLLGVLQASLLGAKDSVTPLIAIVYSTIVNVIGDYTLVNRFHFGLQGAAIATTLAQWAATAALIPAARQKLVRNHDLGLLWSKAKRNNHLQQTINGNGGSDEHHVSGKAFLGFAAPVLTLILGKIAAFGFMTNSAAAAPGQPLPLATHQIILSLLFFCSPFLEVISQTAQTFLPPFLAPMKEYVAMRTAKDATYDVHTDAVAEPWLTAGQRVATGLLAIGFTSAAAVATIASLVPAFFGHWITTDTVIQQAVKPLAKYLWMGAFFWAPVAVSEGVLLARLELKFLASIYLVSTALLPPALLQVKFRRGSVAEVWGCFVVFQLFRAMMFTGRIWGGFAIQNLFGKHPPKNNAKKLANKPIPSK